MVFYCWAIKKVEDILRPLAWKLPMSRSSDEDCLLIEVINDSPQEGVWSMEEHKGINSDAVEPEKW